MIQKIMELFDLSKKTVKQIMINAVMCVAFIGGILSLLWGIFSGLSILQNALTVLVLVEVVLCLYLVNYKTTGKIPYIILCVTIFVAIFPIMYITGGGILGGMPIWMCMGVIATYMLVDGRASYIIAGSEYLIIAVLMFLQYERPEIFTYFEQEYAMFVDSWIAILAISIMIGAVFSLQNSLYKKQLQLLEEKQEELEKMRAEAEIARRDAEAANRAKSSFLANVSHEIRTPIHAVLGMDEMILRESNDPSVIDYARNIESSGHNLLYLVNDILDLSKIESGKMEIIPGEYQLLSLIHDCYNMTIESAKAKNLAFRVENDPFLPKAYEGDEFRIRQIIINLLSNAVKYTSSGEVVLNIRGRKIKDHSYMLQINIKDTGRGISEESQKVLFDSFQRIDEDMDRNIEGTGLGLAIVKQLVDMMGGTIEVRSKIGEGSTFQVDIPQKVVEWDIIGDFSANYTKVSNEKNKPQKLFVAPYAHILAVDDVAMNLNVMRGLLKETRVQLDTAGSGKDALVLLESKKYDLIFMDHMMPEMDGIETARTMKSMNTPNGSTPIVMLTANAILGAKEEYLDAGFSDYLSKPMSGKQLEEMVLKHLPPELVMMSERIISTDITPKAENRTYVPKTKVEKEPEYKPVKNEEPVREPELELERRRNRSVRELADLLPELDLEAGMMYCGNSESLFFEILKKYANDERRDALNRDFEQEDYNDYAIQAHSLKSTSLMLGFKQLSEEAKSLELAAKEGRTGYVKNNHVNVMEHYERVLKEINAFWDK